MATDWQVSEVGDTRTPAAEPGRGRAVQIEWISAWTAHLGFPALLSVPHLLAREIKMNRRHSHILLLTSLQKIHLKLLWVSSVEWKEEHNSILIFCFKAGNWELKFILEVQPGEGPWKTIGTVHGDLGLQLYVCSSAVLDRKNSAIFGTLIVHR